MAQSPQVTVTVNAPVNNPPAVGITAPAPGARFVAGSTVTMTAAAADTDGNVALVEFFVGVVSAGTDHPPRTLPRDRRLPPGRFPPA